MQWWPLKFFAEVPETVFFGVTVAAAGSYQPVRALKLPSRLSQSNLLAFAPAHSPTVW
jgi:hypothetical protein